MTAEEAFPLDDLLLGIVETLRTSLRGVGAEPAHLKTIGLWEGFFGVANLIASDAATELSLPSNCDVTEADVIVNARVACDPAVLEAQVWTAVERTCRSFAAKATFRETQSFRPGRPVPTHRFAETV